MVAFPTQRSGVRSRILLWHFLVGACGGNQVALRVPVLRTCARVLVMEGKVTLTWRHRPWGGSAPFPVHVTSLHAFWSQCVSYVRVRLHMDRSGDFKFEFKSELKSGSVSHVRQEANGLTALNINVLICESNMGRKIILNFQGHSEDAKTTL